MKRIHSIDIVRGIVMIIMAIDHVRDLMHTSSLTQNPVDLATTTPVLFFTRWITYLCAPAFVFLSGVSVWLSFRRSENVNATRNYLLKRGLWLILLEFTLINFALWFDFSFRLLFLQVIAAIGFGFILLALLLKTSRRTLLILATVIICGHNLVQFLPSGQSSFINTIASVLFRQSFFQVSPDFIFFVGYPLIPWFGIMLLGFVMGSLFEQADAGKGRLFFRAGLGLIIAFILLRVINFYGDPVKWSEQQSGFYTFLSFLSVTKYPPSLMFILFFLGVTFLLLCIADRLPVQVQNLFRVYGKVPMFYYLLHLYFIRIAVFIMVYSQGFTWKDLLFGPFQFGRPAKGSGISLPVVYLVSLLIVAALYPLCRWYGKYKETHREKAWLRYL